MDKYKRFYGIILFVAIVGASIYGAVQLIVKPLGEIPQLKENLVTAEKAYNTQLGLLSIQKQRMKKLKDSSLHAPKKICAPAESDLGEESLFFSLYTDLLDMFHANSVKIKSFKYDTVQSGDDFVKFGQGAYFVTDVDFDLVSTYTELGKLLQEIYSYPNFIKIKSLTVVPYNKDKKVLLSKLSLRMYSRTEPADNFFN